MNPYQFKAIAFRMELIAFLLGVIAVMLFLGVIFFVAPA